MNRRDRDLTPDARRGSAPDEDPRLPGEEGGAWVSDSSLPAASHLTELPEAEPPVPEPADDEDEVPTERPGERTAPGVGAFSVEPPEEPRLRSLTIARKEMLRERRRLLSEGRLPTVIDYDRPRSRSDCRDGKRPCLYVACRYHLYLDVNPRTGSIKINFPDREVHELEETCALDVAERGGVTLEEVGAIMNLTRERIRQVEASGLDKLRGDARDLDAFLDD